MKTKLFFLAIILCTAILNTLTSSSWEDKSTIENQLQKVLDKGISKYNARGISATVIFPDQRIWTGISGISSDTISIQPEEKASGTIKYKDGTTQKFIDMLAISLRHYDAKKNITNGIYIEYNDSLTLIPISRLLSLWIDQYYESGHAALFIKFSVDKGFVQAHQPYKLGYVKVELIDDSTGKTTIQTVHFMEQNNLKIKTITFDREKYYRP